MTQQETDHQRPVIVGLGEILWDVFPNGVKFGGAPANFACSAAGLAGESASVFVASAVGQDQLGKQAIDALAAHGVRTDVVTSLAQQTGQVLIELDSDGKAAYRFFDNAAWDNLQWSDQWSDLAARCDAVCFGTLGQRSFPSRKIIQQFVASTRESSLRILDINLRPPFFSDEVIDASLRIANVLKMNDEELPRLAQQYKLNGTDHELVRQLADLFDLRCVALTRGENGAMLFAANTIVETPGQSIQVVDTVGAGDAFTAALAFGLLAGNETKATIEHATATASFVCTQSGATPTIPIELQIPII